MVPDIMKYSKFEKTPKKSDELEERAMKLMENGAASNMAEARVRIYRQDHVLKEQKTSYHPPTFLTETDKVLSPPRSEILCFLSIFSS